MRSLERLESRFSQLSTRTRLVVLSCVIFFVLPAGPAFAGHDFPYAQGVGGVGGYFATQGFDNRDYNRAWHEPGKTWEVFYEDQPSGTSCTVQGTSNPTRCENNGSYKRSWCHNINDNSITLWSCNSTHGFTHRLEESPEGRATLGDGWGSSLGLDVRRQRVRR
jgi:hypothetical protein